MLSIIIPLPYFQNLIMIFETAFGRSFFIFLKKFSAPPNNHTTDAP